MGTLGWPCSRPGKVSLRGQSLQTPLSNSGSRSHRRLPATAHLSRDFRARTLPPIIQNQWDPCARFSGGSDTWRVLLMSGLLHRHCRKPRFTQTGSGGNGSSVCIALVALSLILNPKLWQICSRLKHTLSPAAVHCSSLALNFINLYLPTCSFLFLGSRRLFKV